ncbi:MAG: L-seryl-tRNA(Sec) selenium transferase [Pseudomonadota bacterium]
MNGPEPKIALRHLAAVEKVLAHNNSVVVIRQHGRERLKRAVQRLQQRWRSDGSAPTWAADAGSYASPLKLELQGASPQAVFNLTGTLIHTNLGRAPLAAAALQALNNQHGQATNLEFDLRSGARGHRDQSVAERLCALTGAEAATVVNNCAAALVLTLNNLALNREVPVSRGELIEIGGSFRLPDIMRQAGARLVEVGTTNKTKPDDFENAVSEQTAMLLKVHPSNYAIQGFSRPITLPELAAVGRKHDLPVVEDLGSGALIDLARFGLPAEPRPDQSLASGADLVLFSGDKLLGGPQAGIIVGRADLIAALNRNPLKRALRLDKLVLTALDATLKLYEDPETLAEQLPILRLFSAADATLDERGKLFLDTLAPLQPEYQLSIVDSHCQVGSGAQPDTQLPSRALKLEPPAGVSCDAVLAALRAAPTPVIGRVQQQAVWLDLRAAEQAQQIAAALGEVHFPR